MGDRCIIENFSNDYRTFINSNFENRTKNLNNLGQLSFITFQFSFILLSHCASLARVLEQRRERSLRLRRAPAWRAAERREARHGPPGAARGDSRREAGREHRRGPQGARRSRPGPREAAWFLNSARMRFSISNEIRFSVLIMNISN